MQLNLPEAVLSILRDAGWYEGRNIPVPDSSELQSFPEAQSILSEFGDLLIGKNGAGLECATCSIELDTDLIDYLMPMANALGKALGCRLLLPLGDLADGDGELVIDEKGRMYLLSDELVPFAPNFAKALEMLLLGKNANAEEIQTAWEGNARTIKIEEGGPIWWTNLEE